MIVCANSGDSRAVLISQANSSTNFIVTPLSRDHKPDLQDEALRILKRGGRLEPSRLNQETLIVMLGANKGGGLKYQQPKFYGPKRVWLKNK